MKTRIRNVKGYQKRKSTNGKSCQKDTTELGEKEVDDLHAELLRELKRSKKNFAAIHEMQENTFEKRKHQIQQLAHDKSDKNIVQEIVMKYPFFKVHDCAVSVIYCALRCPYPFWEWTIISLYCLHQIHGDKTYCNLGSAFVCFGHHVKS